MFDLANSSPALHPRRHIVHRNMNFNPLEICHYKGGRAAGPSAENRRRSGPAGPKIQPWHEIRPRKSKQNQAKKLGFRWICSSESGLFNGLRAKK
jgi:hypothetical protein